MKKIALTFLSGLIAFSLTAQKSGLREGDRLFKAFNYKEAAEVYSEVVTKYPNHLEANEKLARAYVLAEDYANAEAVYANIVKLPDASAVNRFYYAQALRANGKYEEAEKEYDAFAKANHNDPRAAEFENGAEKRAGLQENKKEFTVTNFPFNSTESDIAPFYYNGGLLFSSDRAKHHVIANGSYYDLFFSNSDSSGTPLSVKKWKSKQLKNALHEGPSVFTADGKEVYFTASNRTSGEFKRGKNKAVNLKVYHAVYDTVKNKWVDVLPLPFCSSDYSVAHPAISKDGKRLYFVSDMPGGYGETDIYVSFRDGATWATPINLGKNINTPGRELFPFVSSDNTLYFSSDSRIGLGRLDIYSATYSNNTWGNVQNLGVPLNTNFDDFGFIMDSDNLSGYFVSNRDGGLGRDDIYSFAKPSSKKDKNIAAQNNLTYPPTPNRELRRLAAEKLKTITLDSSATRKVTAQVKAETPKVKVEEPKTETTAPKAEAKNEVSKVETTAPQTEVKTDAPKVEAVAPKKEISLSVAVLLSTKALAEGAIVTLTNKATGVQQSGKVTETSVPKFLLEPNQNYELCATKDEGSLRGKYSHPCKTISTQGITSDLAEVIEINYLETGLVIKEDIHFDVNKWVVKPEEEVWLHKIVKYMQDFPQLEIEMTGHTDCIGDAVYNEYLSTQRLQACLNWLDAKNVDLSRILAVGYGETKPAVNCECTKCTPEELQANRRIEIRVMKVR